MSLYPHEAHRYALRNEKISKNAENPKTGFQSSYVPLRPSADTLPAFPIHCLPPRLQSYVAAVAEHTQTPVDMAAGVALGVLATCLQGKVRVEGNPGHYKQTSLYVFIIANLDVWLKGICGDTIRVDRLNREPDYVRHPAVSMILTA